jgi:hypothetical protein
MAGIDPKRGISSTINVRLFISKGVADGDSF